MTDLVQKRGKTDVARRPFHAVHVRIGRFGHDDHVVVRRHVSREWMTSVVARRVRHAIVRFLITQVAHAETDLRVGVVGDKRDPKDFLPSCKCLRNLSHLRFTAGGKVLAVFFLPGVKRCLIDRITFTQRIILRPRGAQTAFQKTRRKKPIFDRLTRGKSGGPNIL
nr:hypothetical protein [Accumulibacter sp.]